MKKYLITGCILVTLSCGQGMAMDGHGHAKEEVGGQHEGMQHGSMVMPDRFMHSEMADDIHSEFQIMSLASMNMTDPDGKSHHIMATFMRDNEKIERLVGKMKVIAPSGKEQLGDLKDFGGGNFAANFTFDEEGKWGVICLFKDDAGKHTVKFWYDHQDM